MSMHSSRAGASGNERSAAACPARGSDLAVAIVESDYSRVSSLSVVPVRVTKRITPLASSKTRPVVP